MKRVAFVSLLAALPLVTSGCTTLFDKFTGSKILANETTTRIIDQVDTDYEVLGPVEATGNSQVILGFIVNQGTEGYGLMMGEAKSRYGNEVTTILFPMTDYEYNGILYPIFGTVTTNYYGTAVYADSFSQSGESVSNPYAGYEKATPFGILGF